MLINLSNHPSKFWNKKQKETAVKTYGSIFNIDFPTIDPNATEPEVEELVYDYFRKTISYLNQYENTTHTNAVHIQGEFTFVFKLVTMLKKSGIDCVASTTIRNVEFNNNSEKIVNFKFVKFRYY